MNSSFPNRWSFSFLKFTKYVTNIIAEPKYKYGRQEQVTIRNHNRSTALERSVLKYWGGGWGAKPSCIFVEILIEVVIQITQDILQRLVWKLIPTDLSWETGRGSLIGSEFAWHASGPEFDPRVRHSLSWRPGHENISTAILPLPLIQEEQLSVTGERMCNKYW